ncbi:hypothetical protein H103_05649 [Trichophyton rubrum CBS 288.86]|uniref:Uncharacterized protein n=1 Tax=Trichophyton rubrum CBS 288.86 TaxID=1215330 RepID=A0A022VXQ2_TRIRU|nr:hypothetical protein H102_05622 [Trichophyton rubrum CBS 100081]EZF50821.1 hypothetical protein H103_05649 [Trichophyton rubrum CBS 288.86]EZF82961.1 hypothetical protein H110_05644 [Trichophyton rubrum MR1448]EZG15124.1 hypothetical protein H107_05785 [Trichophyton rubrum CBS 202.88]
MKLQTNSSTSLGFFLNLCNPVQMRLYNQVVEMMASRLKNITSRTLKYTLTSYFIRKCRPNEFENISELDQALFLTYSTGPTYLCLPRKAKYIRLNNNTPK